MKFSNKNKLVLRGLRTTHNYFNNHPNKMGIARVIRCHLCLFSVRFSRLQSVLYMFHSHHMINENIKSKPFLYD